MGKWNGNAMKEKLLGISVLVLISLSALNPAFMVGLALAGPNTSPHSVNPEGANVDAADATESVSKQQDGLSPSSQWETSNWNFSNVNAWGNLTYGDGNKTRIIVGINEYASNPLVSLREVSARYSATIVNTVTMRNTIRAVVVEIPYRCVAAFEEETCVKGYVSYVEPNMKVQAFFVPNDPYWDQQWGPSKIEADWAWNTTVGNASILVAVVDTGVDYTHPDIAPNYLSLGYDFVNLDPDPMDDYGHGTHCAGIIAAAINNSIGMAGVSQARIMAEKVLDWMGYGYWDWVANGIIHAADAGANVISMSLGGTGDSQLVHDAVKYAYDLGVLIVAAAGNTGSSIKSYPAAYDEVIAVSATDQYDSRAYFSSYGDWVELAAPGVDILSTVPGGYASHSGTSMACPHVSGVAALVWSMYPQKTRDWIRLWLRFSVDDLGELGFDVNYGYGRVNARKAVEGAGQPHELIAYQWETPHYVKPGDSATINATVMNFGEEDETDILVQLQINSTVVDFATIGSLETGRTGKVSLTWSPILEGRYNVTLYVVPVADETAVRDNVLSKRIGVGFATKAVVLHSYGNILQESIVNWQVLSYEWDQFGTTMIYVDYETLNKENITYMDLVTSEADVLIVSCAAFSSMGWEFSDSEINAIETYVHEGHGLIVTAGTLYTNVPNNNKFGRLLGLSESPAWTATYTDLMHVTNRTHPFFADVPDPLVFPAVGTALSTDGQWDSNELAGGKYLALGHYRESAVVTFRGLVYISSWLEVIPPYYYHHLKLIYNAIVTFRYQKPAHELAVSVQANTPLRPGVSTAINATVANLGFNNETNVDFRLIIDNTTVASEVIPELDSGTNYTLSFQWAPSAEGMHNVTGYAPPLTGEEFTENNAAVKRILVMLTLVEKVLVYTDAVTSHYTILALDNIGFKYEHYYGDYWGFFAALRRETWDLIVVANDLYYFGTGYWAALDEYVENGGRLIINTFDIDECSRLYPDLCETLGVRWSSDLLTPEAVYRWDPTNPLFVYPNSVGDLTSFTHVYFDDGDRVEATTGTAVAGFSRAPAAGRAGIVIGNAYSTILFSFLLSESAQDRDVDGQADAVQLWENAIVFLSRCEQHELGVSLQAPKFLQPESSTVLQATVKNRGLSTEADVDFRLLINESVVESIVVPELVALQSVALNYTWLPEVEGTYNVTAYVVPVPGEERLGNNFFARFVEVRPIRYVLFDQTHGTDSVGSYSQWTRNLIERGYVVEKNYGPITSELLNYYNVFVIPQAHSYYSQGELSTIQEYVFGGGGLLVIGDDQPAIFTSLTEFAGMVWFSGGVSGVTTDISPHPVTAGVDSVYLIDPISRISVLDDAQGLVRDVGGNIMLAAAEQPPGKVVGFADETALRDGFIFSADNVRLADNMVDWLSQPQLLEHELEVKLEVPLSGLARGESACLNVTVRNRSVSNETDVLLELLINGTVEFSEVMPELLAHALGRSSFVWSPSVGGVCYNITAYVIPVFGEVRTDNNNATKFVYSSIYERRYFDAQWLGTGTSMNWHADDDCWTFTLPFDFPFYDGYYRTIHVSSNGLISFTGPDLNFANSVAELTVRRAIAVGWDDWTTHLPHDIYTWTNATHAGIRWSVRTFGASGIVGNFEAILGCDGVIQLNYGFCSAMVSATIGVSNGLGDVVGEEISDLNGIRTVVFTPLLVRHDVAVVGVQTSSNDVQTGDAVEVDITAENQGDAAESFNLTAYAVTDVGGSSVRPAVIGGGASIRFDPAQYVFSTQNVSVGHRFNVTLWTANVGDLVAWQVSLRYNNSLLNATQLFEPSWDARYVFYGQTTIVVPPLFELGAVTGGVTLLGGQSFNGTGMLCIVEFEILTVPVSGKVYSCALAIDNVDTFLLDSKIHLIASTRMNGYYEVSSPETPPGYLIGTLLVTDLGAGTRYTFVLFWNTTGVLAGNYRILVRVSVVGGEVDTSDNEFFGGVVTVRPAVTVAHDVAVLGVSVPCSQVYQGWNVTVNVTVANMGDVPESFTVKLYYNATVAATCAISDLGPNETLTVSLWWNTSSVPCRNSYWIRAVADTVAGETDLADNSLDGGLMRVRMLADLNDDGIVDMRDIGIMVKAFGSCSDRSNWDFDADLDQNGRVDMRDIAIVCVNYRKTMP